MSVRACIGSLLCVLMVVLFAFLIEGGGAGRVEMTGTSGAIIEGGENAALLEAPTPSVASGAPVIDASAQSAGVTEDWLGRVMTQIEREEYIASVNERALQAPNRAHKLRTYFQDGGIEVISRDSEAGDAWSFSWRTMGWGREGQLVDVKQALVEPVANGSRVTYNREGEPLRFFRRPGYVTPATMAGVS